MRTIRYGKWLNRQTVKKYQKVCQKFDVFGHPMKSSCRRLKLLKHFDEKATSRVWQTPACCDNCEWPERMSSEVNGAVWVNQIFNAVEQVKTETRVVKFIRGSKAADITSFMQRPGYGQGKDRPVEFWKDVLSQVMAGDWVGTEVKVHQGHSWNSLVLEIRLFSIKF